jgi:hypothetical protein
MGKKVKVRMRKKRNLGRNIAILSFVTVIIVMVIVSIYQQSQQSIQKKPAADEYFSFPDAYAIATPMDETNSSIKISQIGFNITAVGGNATEVYIRPLQGMIEILEDYIIDNITQGESVPIGPVTYDDPIESTKTSDGWPVFFEIVCQEARGKVTIYVVDFVVVSSSGS